MNNPKDRSAARTSGSGSRSTAAGAAVRQTRTSGGRTAGVAFDTVILQVHEVECVKSTKEVDKDEIILAAIALGAETKKPIGGKAQLAARAKKGDLLVVGKFKKGDRVKFRTPKLLARFPAGGVDAVWPRSYHGLLLMIEKDEGAIGAIVNGAMASVEKELTAATSTAAATGTSALMSSLTAGTSIGSLIPIPGVGTAIGAAVGVAVGLAIDKIAKSRADDVFKPKDVVLTLGRAPQKGGQVTKSKKTETFKGFKGVYKVTCSWAVM